MSMDKTVPDYSKYSYQDLLTVRANMDKEKFPDRLRLVERLISEKESDKDTRTQERSFDDKALLGMLTAEVIFWVVVCGLSILGYSLF